MIRRKFTAHLDKLAHRIWEFSNRIRLGKSHSSAWMRGYVTIRSCPWCGKAHWDGGMFCPCCGKTLLAQRNDEKTGNSLATFFRDKRCRHCDHIPVGGGRFPAFDGGFVQLADPVFCPSCQHHLP